MTEKKFVTRRIPEILKEIRSNVSPENHQAVVILVAEYGASSELVQGCPGCIASMIVDLLEHHPGIAARVGQKLEQKRFGVDPLGRTH